MDYLSDLNAKQREAALHKDGPLLIIAGAGTGKTKTLTHRIANLIAKGVSPSSILAVTFTNKAAREMRERIGTMLRAQGAPVSFGTASYGGARSEPFVGTFHSLGVHILREKGTAVGVSRNFSILDSADALATLRAVLKEKGIDVKQFPPEQFAKMISKRKSSAIVQSDADAPKSFSPAGRILPVVWRAYEDALRTANALDFDDLILKTVLLLQNSEDTRAYYNDKWRYIHIDEYQDTNTSQYKLARLLTGEGKNICAVGDADQNIYSWRGANIRNILDFEKDYAGAVTVVLEENYRSTKNILSAANDVIRKNVMRKEKNLFTQNADGESVSLFPAYDEGHEASFIASKSAELIRSGVSPADIAVLYRANFQSRALEEAFLSRAVPYQVLGVKFFERKEVKDTLAFIRCALNPANPHDIKRVINVPPRGIGAVSLAKITEGREGELSAKIKEKLASFRGILAGIAREAEHASAHELVEFTAKKSGLMDYLATLGEEGAERILNIRELAVIARKYEGLPPAEQVEKLLADAALATDQDSLEKSGASVRLMTVHASKGLEFRFVFVAGLEDGLFPFFGSDGETAEKKEEERRLCYVALTRAKEKLFLTYASFRTIFGSQRSNIPSEFVSDIDSVLFVEDFAPDRKMREILF